MVTVGHRISRTSRLMCILVKIIRKLNWTKLIKCFSACSIILLTANNERKNHTYISRDMFSILTSVFTLKVRIKYLETLADKINAVKNFR